MDLLLAERNEVDIVSDMFKKPEEIDYVLDHFYSIRGQLVSAIANIDKSIDMIRRRYEHNSNE